MIGQTNPNYPGKAKLPEGVRDIDLQAARDELDWLKNAMTQDGVATKLLYGHLKQDDLEIVAESLVGAVYNSINICALRDEDIAESAGLSRWMAIAERAFVEAFNNTEIGND